VVDPRDGTLYTAEQGPQSKKVWGRPSQGKFIPGQDRAPRQWLDMGQPVVRAWDQVKQRFSDLSEFGQIPARKPRLSRVNVTRGTCREQDEHTSIRVEPMRGSPAVSSERELKSSFLRMVRGLFFQPYPNRRATTEVFSGILSSILGTTCHKSFKTSRRSIDHVEKSLPPCHGRRHIAKKRGSIRGGRSFTIPAKHGFPTIDWLS